MSLVKNKVKHGPKTYLICEHVQKNNLCTIFMMVFGMTRAGHEPMTYHMMADMLTTKLSRRGPRI